MKRILTHLTLIGIPALILVSACEKIIEKETFEVILPTGYGRTLSNQEHAEQLKDDLTAKTQFGKAAVFGDIYSLAGIPPTKAALPEVPFLDLLDLDALVETSMDGISVTEIPFKGEIDYQEISLQYPDEDLGFSATRRYFVFLENAEGCMSEIVTLVPTRQMLEAYGPLSFSYLDRSRFDGLVIHCDIEGNFLATTSNRAGPVYVGETESINEADDNAILINIPVPGEVETKSGWRRDGNGGFIETTPIEVCVCIGSLNKLNDRTIYYGHPVYGNNSQENEQIQGELDNSVGGGGPGGKKDGFGDPVLRKVTIHEDGDGETSGSGSYSLGYKVNITATGNDPSEFIRWEGEFAGRDENFVLTVEKDVESTAVFQDMKSCYDAEKGVNATVNSTSIAPTSGTNYRAGTYGNTRYNRDGSKKFHGGIDIAADPGTPIYAPQDGIVTYLETSHKDGQIKAFNRHDACGNQMHLKCGNTTYYFYHLRSKENGGAVAPGITKGSSVKRGQLIAYTGDSGNMATMPNKHLHLETWVNGVRKDPKDYINGTIDTETGEISLNCDKEYTSTTEDDPQQVSWNWDLYVNKY